MLAMPNIFLRTIAFAALGTVFWYSNASAQQAQPSPLEFVEADPIVLTPGEPVQLQLRNNTSKSLTVSVQLMDLKHEDSDSLSKHVSISPPSGFELRPAGGVILTLTLAAGFKVDPSRSVALLSAFESETNTFTRRAVHLKKGDAGEGAPKDKLLRTFSTSWSAAGHYTVLDTLSCDKWKKPIILDTHLPLEPDAKTDKLAQGKSLAILFNEAGDAGVVEYIKTETLPGGLPGIQLAFKGAGCCGKYKGKINKDIGTEKDDVEVTVVVSHHWLYALVMLILGVATAFFFKERYIGVSRPLFILEERRALIEDDYLRAQATFKKNHANEPYSRYSIEIVFNKMMTAAGAYIGGLRDKSFSSLDSEDLKKAQASLDELRRLVNEWTTFPSGLAALKAAHAAVIIDSSTRRPPTTPPHLVPAIVTKAAKLLNEGGELDVAWFREIHSSISSLAILLNRWLSFNDEAAKLWDAIHEPSPPHPLKQISEDKQEELVKVDDTLGGLWYDLWMRSEYKNEEMQANFELTAKTIQLLSLHFKDAVPEGTVADGADRSFRSAGVAAERARRAGSETPQQRGQRYRIWRRILDVLFVSISLAIAVYTGFSQLYIGQAFGTWQDYIKIFLWGFGVQATLTAVLTGLNLLWNSRASLRMNVVGPRV